ncbi:MAG: PAS domain S-box protein [Acidobacteriota bacterium]
MSEKNKTKKKLNQEIEKLHQRIKELERAASECRSEKNELKESKELFRSLFEATFEGIVVHDKGNILDANQTFARIFGYDLKEIIGMNVAELAAPEWRKKIIDSVLSGREDPYQAQGLRKDGSVFPGELRGRKIRYKGREARITAVRDLTKQKKAEDAKEKLLHNLRERNKELNLLYEVSELSSKADLSLKDLLQKSVELIPSAWHYPDITCARIVVENKQYESKKFKKTKWSQSEDIKVAGKKLGSIEVCHLEEKPELNNGPFLKEERDLINTFSSLLSSIIERKKTEEALKQSEEKYASVVEKSNDAIIIHHNGIIKFANEAASQYIGIAKNEIIGKVMTDFVHPEDRETVIQRFEQRKARKEVESIYEISLTKKDGSVLPVEINVSLIQHQGKPAGLVFLRDITERKKAEAALKRRESYFRDIFENADIGIAYSSLGGKVLEINKALEEILGVPSQKIEGKNIVTLTKEFLTLKNTKQILPIIRDILRGKEVRPFEVNYKDKILEIRSTYNPESKRITGLIKDITEQRKAEEKIKKSLQEKEVLLKEIHHRVKNNMQVISSLINIQARRIKDPEAQEMFKAARNRVMSMALVHERLYRSEDLAGIDFSQYIEKMSVHLMSYYRELSQNIELKKEIENIFLDVTKAVPLGLITNELLTNSLKHAFTNKEKGEIKIEFFKKANTYYLSISDNGKEFPKNLDFRKAESMGLDLVNSLVEQIKGNIELHRNKGTTFEITFKD